MNTSQEVSPSQNHKECMLKTAEKSSRLDLENIFLICNFDSELVWQMRLMIIKG